MPAQDGEFGAGGRVPQPGGVILRDREHLLPVGAEATRRDRSLMPAQDGELGAGGRIPQPACAVP